MRQEFEEKKKAKEKPQRKQRKKGRHQSQRLSKQTRFYKPKGSII
jgi:hypothetical protein